MPDAATTVFISYSHKDSIEWDKHIRDFLAPLEREGIAEVWMDQRIRAGEDWRQAIDQALDRAGIAVLFISQGFMASSFIVEEELPRLLARQQAGDLTVLPVFLKPSTVGQDAITFNAPNGTAQRIRLTGIQGFGRPDQPLSTLSVPKRQAAYRALAARIRELAADAAPVVPPGVTTPPGPGATPPAAPPKARAWPAVRGLALILTALPEELAAVRAWLRDCEEVEHGRTGTLFERGYFDAGENAWQVLLGETGMGNERAAVIAERGIELADPEVVLFVGIAGGIKGVALGDLVVPNKVYQYEYGKDEGGFKPRPEVNQPSHRALERAKAVARAGTWLAQAARPGPGGAVAQVLFKPIAAGSKVLADTQSALFQFIRTQYGDAAAVEMEGWGALEVMRQGGIEGLVVRGISDLIDGKETADAAGWRYVAAQNAAAFAFAVLGGLKPQPPKSTPALSPTPNDPFTPWDSLPLDLRSRTVEALLQCDHLDDPGLRTMLAGQLPADIRRRLRLGNTSVLDVTAIVRTCYNAKGGIQALKDVLGTHEQGTHCLDGALRMLDLLG